MADLKALAAKQRAKVAEVISDDVDIMFGGEKVTLTVERVHPDTWDALMLANPARRGSKPDEDAGYNTMGVSLAYPRLLNDGEAMTKEEVAELFADLDSIWRNAIGIVIWGVNVNHALAEMRSVGKAQAGRKSP